MLMRGFARLGREGSLSLPRNFLLALGLKENQILELKIVGASKAKQLLVSKRERCR